MSSALATSRDRSTQFLLNRLLVASNKYKQLRELSLIHVLRRKHRFIVFLSQSVFDYQVFYSKSVPYLPTLCGTSYLRDILTTRQRVILYQLLYSFTLHYVISHYQSKIYNPTLHPFAPQRHFLFLLRKAKTIPLLSALEVTFKLRDI